MIFRHDLLKPKTWKGELGMSYVQIKENGHRVCFFVQPSGEVLAFTGNGKPIDLSWCRWFQHIQKLHTHTSLDGEIVVPGRAASYVSTALAERWSILDFRLFAIPYYNGLEFYDETLEFVSDLAALHGLGNRFVPFSKFDPNLDYKQLAVTNNCEGYVLKDSNYAGWYKVKPTKTIDVYVTGTKDGKGKYLGLVGALLVSVYYKEELVEIASVSGMTDEVRVDVSSDERLMVAAELDMRVCEVEYQTVGVGGRLIHPRFIRWRPDKIGQPCTVDQDNTLVDIWRIKRTIEAQKALEG